MRNDECPMTKEARMTKKKQRSERLGLLQDLDATGSDLRRIPIRKLHDERTKAGTEKRDGVLTGSADCQQGGGEGVGLGGRRQDDRGQVSVVRRMAGAG